MQRTVLHSTGRSPQIGQPQESLVGSGWMMSLQPAGKMQGRAGQMGVSVGSAVRSIDIIHVQNLQPTNCSDCYDVMVLSTLTDSKLIGPAYQG